MVNPRFNSRDRQLVIDFLDGHFGAHFEPVGSYRKLLVYKNTVVLMFGSVGDWHGLDNDFMKMVSAFGEVENEGFIVLADKKGDRIDVFSGLLKTFIDEKDKLLRNKDGDYQFHHERIGDKVVLKEGSSLEMNLLGTVRW